MANSYFLRYPKPREVLSPPKPVLVLSPKGNSSQRGSHLDPTPGSMNSFSLVKAKGKTRLQKGLLSTWSGRLDGHPRALRPCPGWEGFPRPAEHVLCRAGDEWSRAMCLELLPDTRPPHEGAAAGFYRTLLATSWASGEPVAATLPSFTPQLPVMGGM